MFFGMKNPKTVVSLYKQQTNNNNNNKIMNIQYEYRGHISRSVSFRVLLYLDDNKIDIDFTNTHIKACLCNT